MFLPVSRHTLSRLLLWSSRTSVTTVQINMSSSKTRHPCLPHEFKKRFYECSTWFAHSYVFFCSKKCKCIKIAAKSHNRELLHLLPKRMSPFDENSETRECFWGLYAKNDIKFFRVMVWNLVCMSPLLWFFFMRLFIWGPNWDMQNAVVPAMLALGLMSHFWCIFIALVRSDKGPWATVYGGFVFLSYITCSVQLFNIFLKFPKFPSRSTFEVASPGIGLHFRLYHIREF